MKYKQILEVHDHFDIIRFSAKIIIPKRDGMSEVRLVADVITYEKTPKKNRYILK